MRVDNPKIKKSGGNNINNINNINIEKKNINNINMNTDMKWIKKNNELMLVTVLENGYDDLEIGDKFIRMSDENTLVTKYNYSGRTTSMVAKVIWYYGKGDSIFVSEYTYDLCMLMQKNKRYIALNINSKGRVVL